MLVRNAISAVLSVWVLVISVAAQAPTFAGKWVVDWTLTDAANAQLGGPGEPHGDSSPWTITQDATEVTIQQGNLPARRYKLDGTDSVNTLRSGATLTSHATLDRGTLRIVTKSPQGTATNVYTLDKDTLKLVSSTPGRDGSAMVSTALVFRRSK